MHWAQLCAVVVMAVMVSGQQDFGVVRAIRQISFGQGGRPSFSRQPQTTQCGGCLPAIMCPQAELRSLPQCRFGNGNVGVCCSVRRGASTANRRMFTEPRVNVPMRDVSRQELDHACRKGMSDINRIGQLEQDIMSNRRVVSESSPAHGHLKFFKLSGTARQNHRRARAVSQASVSMLNDLSLTKDQGMHSLRNIPVRNTLLSGNCPSAPRCNTNAKYRSVDGTCNNLRNPLLGRSETAFQRILPPQYDDGVSSPHQTGATGRPLPNERVVSSSVLVDRPDEDREFTSSVMQWAQFVDHDLTHSPFMTLENGEGIECCPGGEAATGASRHPDCLPINIPRNDPFYAPRNQFCMNFVRSLLALSPECTFGFSEQMNALTHWLDASNIYGSTEEENRRLRAGRGGELAVSEGDLQPLDPESRGDCNARARGRLCFHAGDSRVNEQPGLTAMHILFTREHNRVARGLQALNPQWSDEQTYQEARRIVTAAYQHIIFNEWLPIIVGTQFMQSFGISPLLDGYSFDYSATLNPNMNNEFATAAFRFGHSLVQGQVKLYDANNREQTIRLRDHFNSPHIFQENPAVVDMFARSFTKQQIQKFDSFVTDDLSNHLFQTPQQNFGMDLMALNLHRARDHAIAGYNAIRQICGLPRARTFADFNDQIPSDIIPRLEKLYASPDDVDFFVGGMSEKPVKPGLLGWTFLCVVGDQFARVKKGDRFFYDLGGQPSSFTPPQLQQIRRASWARILCDNSRIGAVQPLAFRSPDPNINQIQRCDSAAIPRVDLTQWRGERPGV